MTRLNQRYGSNTQKRIMQMYKREKIRKWRLHFHTSQLVYIQKLLSFVEKEPFLSLHSLHALDGLKKKKAVLRGRYFLGLVLAKMRLQN